MKTTEIQFGGLEITGATNLDPIRVLFHDDEAGGGRVIITCWNLAWCNRWGAQGIPIREFFIKANIEYLVHNLCTVDYVTSQRARKKQSEYLTRIVVAIKAALINKKEDKQ